MEHARLVVWQVTETAGFDAAWVRLGASGLTAEGEAVGQQPRAYTLRYRLEAEDDWATSLLRVEATDDGGSRTLELRRGARGWTVDGTPRTDLDDARDCDLEACPLTNTMPIRRLDLHRSAGDRTFLMAFVQVPSLEVLASRQRYTTVRPVDQGGDAVVRYRSDGFESELQVDDDGLVVVYPQLGRRISAARAG
jgi:hypothetical protein